MAIAQFRTDIRGGVAPMFALLLVPLIGAVGSAVDYTIAAKIRSQLIAAADSATIGSVSKGSTAVTAAANMGSDGSISAGVSDAKKIFNAYVTNPKGFSVSDLSVQVVKSGSKIVSTVGFTAQVPTHFMGLFGINTVPVSGTSTASTSLPTFIDFYLLLDNTPSMGVGATTTDINTMVASTSDKCAFACHDLSDANNYYSLAKKLGVTMRIDVLRTATQQLMDTAKTTATYSNQFRMALYTFGASAKSPKLTAVQSLTSNLTTAKTSASAIDLMTVPYQNYAGDTDTNFNDVLTDVNDEISTPGTGASSSSPQKYLFFVSDGVGDRVNGSPGCPEPVTTSIDPQTGKSYVRCQEPLDAALCTTIKKRGVKIAVLYTTYLPLPTNAWYNAWIAPFASQIATSMQSCASPGLYFEVGPDQGVSEALKALFQKAVAQARFTK